MVQSSLQEQLSKRIDVVDSLRGLALFGLYCVHMQEHYNLFDFPKPSSEWMEVLDAIINKSVYFLFAGKSYAIFAFMFGLSFYIQMERQADKGIDFRTRFSWRLLILFVIGFVHGLLYTGDILAFFALLGILLVILYKASTKFLLAIAAILFLQIPALIALWYDFSHPDSGEIQLVRDMFRLYEDSVHVYAHGTFLEMISFNWFEGKAANWLYMLLYGRVAQTLGLFFLGMIAGRRQLFRDLTAYRSHFKTTLKVSIAVFIPFFILSFFLPETIVDEQICGRVETIVASYSNLAFAAFLVSGFVLLYEKRSFTRVAQQLGPAGRMSLTNYLLQSIVFVPFFYGFGLGLYDDIGFTNSFLLGAVFYILQTWFSKWWMERYHFGPFEWVWRAATYTTTTISFKKNKR